MMFAQATAAADQAIAEGKQPKSQVGNPDEDRKAKITYLDALRQLIPLLTPEAFGSIVREDWSGAPLLLRTVPALRPKLKTAELKQQRDQILALAKTAMDRGVLHERMLMSLHRAITKSEVLPPRFGPQWEVIGFQGNDPATDLRGAGVLALLNMLQMNWKRPKLVQDIFAISQGGTAFPMMTVSINLTQVTMTCLRSGALTREANRACKGSSGAGGGNREGALFSAFHSMHAACWLHLTREWKRRGLGIQDFGFLRKEIEALAVKKPNRLLGALKTWDLGPAAQLIDGSAGAVNFG